MQSQALVLFIPKANVIKNIYICYLQMLVISWSVCPREAFPFLSNVSELSRNPTETSTLQVLHSRVGFWPCTQTLELKRNGLLGTNNLAFYEDL